MSKFNILRGHLFKVIDNITDRNIAVAHCVGKDMRMGKGIATVFKKRYNQVAYLKSNAVIKQTIFLQEGNLTIGYIVTKNISAKDYPTKINFKLAVDDLYSQLREMKIYELYIPKIGAGLDKLSINYVLSIISEMSIKYDINTTMVLLPSDKVNPCALIR